jgi:hypothetical protein
VISPDLFPFPFIRTFFTYLDAPVFSRIIPNAMAAVNTMEKYTRAVLSPARLPSIVSIIGFKRGDAIKNDITAPKGTPASSNPRVTGMVEHTQKGVKAPKIAPIK